MEYTFSTQMLGTLLFLIVVLLQLYLGYIKSNNLYYKGAVALLLLGITLTYVWNPVKLVSPKMSDIEYQEKPVIVVPTKIKVNIETLEQKQNELEIKLKEK